MLTRLTSRLFGISLALVSILISSCSTSRRVAGICFEERVTFDLPDSLLPQFAEQHVNPVYIRTDSGEFFLFFQEDVQRLHAWDMDARQYRFSVDLSGYRPEGFKVNKSKIFYYCIQGLDSIWLALPPAGTHNFSHRNMVWLAHADGRSGGSWSLNDPRLPPFEDGKETNRWLFAHLSADNRLARSGSHLAFPLAAWNIYAGEADFHSANKPAGVLLDTRTGATIPIQQPVPALPDPAGPGHWPWNYGCPMISTGPPDRFLLSFAFSDTVYEVDTVGRVLRQLGLHSSCVPPVRPLATAYRYRQETIGRIPEQPSWSLLYYDPWQNQYIRFFQRKNPKQLGEQAEQYRYGICLFDSSGTLLAQDTLPAFWYPWSYTPTPKGALFVDGSPYPINGGMTVHRTKLQPSLKKNRRHPQAAAKPQEKKVAVNDWYTYFKRADIELSDSNLRVLYIPVDRSCASCLEFTLKQLSQLDPRQLTKPLRVIFAGPHSASINKAIKEQNLPLQLDSYYETNAARQNVYSNQHNPVWIEFDSKRKLFAKTLNPAEIQLLPLLLAGKLRAADIE